VLSGREFVAAPPKEDGVRVLVVQRVVNDDPVEVVLRLQRQRRRAGFGQVGGLVEATAGGHHDLAKAAELEMFGDVEGLRQTDQHALAARSGPALSLPK
jgi:hypothetical protein